MKDLLQTAITAALEAGEAILEIYNTDFEVEYKGDDSPLTIADTRANTIINSYLKKTSLPIISEENKQISFDVRKKWDTCWIVDPVDGTKEFIKKNGEFTVNIALVKKGIPYLGVIYVPVSRTLYFTAADAGISYKYQVKSTSVLIDEIVRQAIPLLPNRDTSQGIKVVGSRSHLNQATEEYVATLAVEHNVEIVSKGSSLKFCLVAEGAAHVYPRFAPTMEWDTAAGQAICQAVGVHVINRETNKPLLYNKENLLNPFFLVKS